MLKKDLIKYVANETNYTQKDVEAVIDLTLETIKRVVADEEVRLTNFGTFNTTEIAAREGRNPRTGEKIQIAASKRITFKPSKQFKEDINDEK